jgi:hypothetical protein
MKQVSTSTQAIAWMLAKRGRTQNDASDKFGISQGAISCTKSREDNAILLCERMPDVAKAAHEILKDDPTRTARAVSYKLGLPDAEARKIVLGLHAKAAREDAFYKEAGADMKDAPDGMDAASRFGFARGRESMREDAAVVVESIGGEYGAIVAAAIRGLV